MYYVLLRSVTSLYSVYASYPVMYMNDIAEGEYTKFAALAKFTKKSTDKLNQNLF